ncbi:hypothetical protein MNBD_PLANCTO03-987 [hydrothermal vent metagenome]|uniref:Tyrosine specific protein phosphatases domain-containing protein n=1 Tax=hydrothermal vent metagenome TaxID=652676 RepID=A0A3B1DZI9_9ZZZZ
MEDTLPGLHNLFVVAPDLFSGSGPETTEVFDSLAQLGVKILISVDGARPNLELARERGMGYIHIPIGYDALDPEQQIALTKALRDSPGPIYIHCHHGVHRGPAAAAVALVGLGRMTNHHAAEFLRAAGTSTNYPGLWASVEQARPIADLDVAFAEAGCELVEYQPVSGMVAGMVAIDGTWDRIELIRAAGWQTPPDHPDLSPAAETGILADHYRALVDDPDTRAEGAAFLEAMQRAAEEASALEASLTRIAPDPAFTERVYRAITKSCTDCHKEWRN